MASLPLKTRSRPAEFDNYKSAREWVTPEPGAGLIRDTPVLIAPSELYAYPGRGGLLVYELDKDNNRVPEPEKKDAPKEQRRRRRRPTAGMGGGGMMGGGMGGAPKKKTGKSRAEIERELKADDARRQRELNLKLSGGNQPQEESAADKKEKAAEAQEPPGKEIVKGYRWVAITGTLDHAQMLANYRQALKNPAVAHPNYRRLDVQRQSLQRDGSWSKWAFISADENFKVLDNLPEEDEELTPENVRPFGLVDALPFLKSGLWEKVHIGSLVAEEKKKIVSSLPPGGLTGGRGMMGGGGMMPGMMGGGMMGGRGGAGGMGGGMMGGGMMGRGMMGAGMMGGGMMGRGMMGGGMMGGGMMGGAAETVGDFWRSEEKKVMIRAFDFTVEPDTTYRYRVRIVVFNPNYKHEDVTPNAKLTNTKEELVGPWSSETDMVTMPPDIMPYVTGTMPPSLNRLKIQFEVIRFHPEDGVTIPKRFEAGAQASCSATLELPRFPSRTALERDPRPSTLTAIRSCLTSRADFTRCPPVSSVALSIDPGWPSCFGLMEVSSSTTRPRTPPTMSARISLPTTNMSSTCRKKFGRTPRGAAIWG